MTFVAPCRLHFGLFHVPIEGLTHWPDGTPVRKFGGLGMMIREPNIRYQFEESKEWSAVGSLATRALEFARRVPNARPRKITIDGPGEHVGLGVGTAVGMAVTSYLLKTASGMAWSDPRWTIPYAVSLSGRGNRSGIGVHGFSRGGFIVDDGKLEDELPRVRQRIDMPTEWRVVLARPPVPGAWHGEAERTAFRRQRTPAEALDTTTRLLKLANEFIIPALKRADFDTFAANLTDFNRIAGEPFNDDQGGPYAGPAVAGIIDELIDWGALGVGQSSWGPTVFAFTRCENEGNELATRLRDRFPNLADLRVTTADNQGVCILPDDQPS